MRFTLLAALVLALGCKGEAAKKRPEPAPEAKPEPAPHPGVGDQPAGGGIIAPIPAPERPASVTDRHMALVDRLAAVAVAVEKVVRAHTTDCDATAAALAALTAKSAADVATTQAALDGLTKSDAAAAAYIRYRLAAEQGRGVEMIALTEMCKGHKGVNAAVAGALPLVGMQGATIPTSGGEGWTGPRPPGVTDEQVAAIDELGAWFGEIATAAEKAKGNCPAMAKALAPLMAKGKKVSARAKGLQEGVKSRSPEWEWLGSYTVQKVSMKRLMKSMDMCWNDPAVKKTFEGFGP